MTHRLRRQLVDCSRYRITAHHRAAGNGIDLRTALDHRDAIISDLLNTDPCPQTKLPRLPLWDQALVDRFVQLDLVPLFMSAMTDPAALAFQAALETDIESRLPPTRQKGTRRAYDSGVRDAVAIAQVEALLAAVEIVINQLAVSRPTRSSGVRPRKTSSQSMRRGPAQRSDARGAS